MRSIQTALPPDPRKRLVISGILEPKGGDPNTQGPKIVFSSESANGEGGKRDLAILQGVHGGTYTPLNDSQPGGEDRWEAVENVLLHP